MKENADIIFNSEKDVNLKMYQIASGYISQTKIFFEKENVLAVIEAKGTVEFYGTDEKLIASGKVPPVVSGKEVYEEVGCQTENNMIKLQFPIYEWIDNYPHCDGEHDRWDTKIIGYHTLTLDLLNGSVL